MGTSQSEGSESEIRDPIDNLDFIQKLTQRHKENLRRTCADLGLSADQIGQMEFQARMLREFQKHGKDALQTPAQRIKTLGKIAEAALALEAEVKRLGGSDIVRIWEFMEPDQLASGERGYPLPGRPWYVSNEAGKLAKAAQLAMDDLKGSTKEGGRKSVLNVYARHVFEISLCVRALQPGRGGEFERLCNAVFDAAEVPARAEGAIRKFLDNRKAGYYFFPADML